MASGPITSWEIDEETVEIVSDFVLGDSKESSPKPQFKSINSSVLSFLYGPTLPCIHDDCWENLALTYGPMSVK